jgi:hypothetical protein
MRWETALARMSSGSIRSDAPDAPPGPDLQPVELRSISMSADEKATDDRPAALLPMNERRDMLFFLDMRDLLMETYETFNTTARPGSIGRRRGHAPFIDGPRSG